MSQNKLKVLLLTENTEADNFASLLMLLFYVYEA